MQNLSISQSLSQKLSPQQIQFIKLLQVSSSNITGAIKKEIESNPALEEENDSISNEENINLEDYKSEEETYKTKTDFRPYNKRKEIPFSVGTSLQEKLLDQLGYLKLNEKDKIVANQIIGTIDEDGYLRRDLESIIDDIVFSENFEPTLENMKSILFKIQDFDPPGIAARNLKECLYIQLNRIDEKNKQETLAQLIIVKYYNEFINKHYDKIIDKIGEKNIKEIKKAITLIKNLNPKPGGSMDESNHTEYLIPDFILRKEGNDFELTLSSKNSPHIKLSKDYISMFSDLKTSKNKNEEHKKSYDFVKQKLESAKWFIEALEQRQNTLLKTMNTIIELQYDFFNNGDDNLLKPMILKDISKKIDMDISTVSRIVSSKVIQTDFGIFPLKFFFSEAHIKKDGEIISSKKVKNLLKKLIGEEDKREPYSDEKLEKILNKKGYNIARRTISKYREQLNIAVSRLRRDI